MEVVEEVEVWETSRIKDDQVEILLLYSQSILQ